jgi:antitoxin component YwqK of YwqJK toxin-antitoxin module
MIDKTIIAYYPNGQKKNEANYKNDKLNGLWTAWYESGQKQLEGNCKDDKNYGLWTEFSENGQKLSELNFKNDKKEVHQEKMKRFNVDISASLHKAMKTQAAKHGLNLNTLTIHLFTKYLQKKAE